MKKPIVWLLLIAIVLVIAFSLFKKQDVEPVVTPAPKVTVEPTKPRCVVPISPEDIDLCLHQKGA